MPLPERAGIPIAGTSRRAGDAREDWLDLRPVEMPHLPPDAIALLLNTEAAAACDGLTLTGRDDLLTEQGPDDWPNIFA